MFFLFHVIGKQLLCHLWRPFLVSCESLSSNFFFDVLLGQRSKPGSYVFASSSRNHAPRSYMTWLPVTLSVLDMITTARWRPRRWFRKFTLRFRPIRKEIVSWMFNNTSNSWAPRILPWIYGRMNGKIIVVMHYPHDVYIHHGMG